jgi:hypothetical protein
MHAARSSGAVVLEACGGFAGMVRLAVLAMCF